jgi:phage tail protein X
MMSTGLSRLVALGILVLGVCAALPFYQRPSSLPHPVTPSRNKDELAWHLQDLNLQVAAPDKPSPIPNAPPVTEAQVGRQPTKPASVHRHPTLGSVPPPDLAFKYQSLLPGSQPDPTPASADERPTLEETGTPTANDTRPGTAKPERAPAGDPEATETAGRDATRHRVVDGDTLEKLARKYLGKGERAMEIFQANRSVLDDPDVLPIGLELALPSSGAEQAPGGHASKVSLGQPSSADADGLVPVRAPEPSSTATTKGTKP